MDSSFNDKEYRKYKLLVKSWEYKFKKRENRNPTKDDIKKAPNTVKEAYKMYWILKTAILEETILDDEINESTKSSTDVSEINENLENASSNNMIKSNNDSNAAIEILPEKKINQEEEKSSIEESQKSPQNNNVALNSNTVWGNHLNKPAPKDEKSKIKRSTSFQFSEKLFKGSNFKKRNPRKSLNLSNRSKSSNIIPLNEESQDVPTTSPEQSNIVDEPPIDLGETIKVTNVISSVNAQPVHILQKLDNLNVIQTKCKLNTGWLERCNQTCNLNKDSVEKSPCNENDCSDDDMVFSSDDESSRNTYNLTKRISHDTIQKEMANFQSFGNKNGSEKINDHDSRIALKEPTVQNTSENFPLLSNKPCTSPKVPVDIPADIMKTVDIIQSSSKRPASEDLPRPCKKIKAVENYDQIRKEKMLLHKLESGKANENFVCLNMKKKIYARGKKTMTGTKYKKQQWKMKKKMSSMNTDVGGVQKCFKCGDVGHFSRQCKNNNYLIPKEDISDEEDCPFPTLEEAADMVKETRENKKKRSVSQPGEEFVGLEEPEEDIGKRVPPLYEFKQDCVIDTPQEVFEALSEFGYEKFRPGQEEAIMRILYGKSTLFISSTGSGKSLCYQIPAYLYAKKFRCISLVISPLVSLMEDQVINFPKVLTAACLHTNQTEAQRNEIMEKIKRNEIAVVLVSPEAMVSTNSVLNKAMLKDFPPIAFACIDEVHCVSQWSHNFRTSYLMICKILKERFSVHTLLGLTATATKSTVACIKDHLSVDDEEDGVIQDKILPDNLILSVSKDENRDRALIRLLQSDPFCDYKSIIIYCIRRNECERLAALLRSFLKDVRTMEINVKTRKTLSPDVEEYHAGLSAARRKRVQNAFMSGKIRIVVATVAFGMGINKSDIRGIIHYNMPRTYEHYVQEIGRAGRDGLPARCHLFLDPEGNDLPELRRQIYANSVDRHIIRKLLQNVFTSCRCEGVCNGHEVAFSVENTVRALDLNQENITTLLCYLELLPDKIVQVLPPSYVTCTVLVYGGTRALKNAAKKCPPLAYAIAEHCNNSKNNQIPGKLEFSVIELADKIGWKSGTVKNELKRSEWTEVNGRPKKSGITVNLSNLGFHVLSSGTLTSEQMDNALDTLYSTVQSQEKKALHQLKTCYDTFHSYAFSSAEECLNSEELEGRSENLKNIIRDYFSQENANSDIELPEVSSSNEVLIACDVHRLVNSYKDCTFTGRAIARIFHGIESPNFPAVMWTRSPFWRCGLKEDFNLLCRIANRELIKLK